ncbi:MULTISPECIES: thioredoxin family protein [Bacillaceae]|uniref:Thioredoxin n=1 Tax=Domibacillus aminovorans TaxID=29332 RepID=A0A177KNK0_9BACI|nr:MULTISPECIES: thioredoxin family protein [Bacillaceae]OAH54724.1 thioredoxin [Domibacillus aminovorans]OAH61644.1 thioredoxin [Domibacillus aminovorans]
MDEIKTSDQFEQLIASSEPVIVKFYAGWCPDCTRMDMFIDDIIADYGKYKWVKINRDDFSDIAEKYDVMGIPSLLLFQDGEKLAHLHSANAKSPEEVRDYLKSLPA